MSTLFKQIWNRNFKKGREPLDKLASDIGGIKGQVTWTKLVNGVAVESQSFNNEVTQLSKSTAIRLLAQGSSSPYRGTIDPTSYKISRMRFGNAPTSTFNSNDDKILSYYNPLEKSFRNNSTNYLGGVYPYAAAGGRTPGVTGVGIGPILAESGTDVGVNFTAGIPGAQFPDTVWTTGNTVSFNIDSAFFPDVQTGTPPSHKTLQLQFYTQNGINTNTPEATLTFNNIYSRSVAGTNPTGLTGAGSESSYIAAVLTAHSIQWVASTGKWRVNFKLSDNTLSLSLRRVKVSFKIGNYNVINSIVPRAGYNGGTASATRFSSLDYYSINPASVTYTDSPSNAIDDYAATFSVTMNTTEGNGVVGIGVPVVYTEAFLFNDRDDLFSIVRFNPPEPYATQIGQSPGAGFVKDPNVAFLISWQLKSLI